MVCPVAKYSLAESPIQVQLTNTGEHVQASVRDQGPGIAASDQERIFEKFTRLRVKESPRGLGLGLAFCRLVVEAHGGRTWAESELGKGTTMYFVIPAEKKDRPKPAV